MARRFFYRLNFVRGLLSRIPGYDYLREDDLPLVESLTPGTYTNSTVTVDPRGRVVQAANGSGGGGGTAILEQIWAYFAANNADPIDTKITSGNYVVLIFLSSQNAAAWKDATNAVHTVGVGKTLTLLQRFSVGSVADANRDGRLQNTTDATTVDVVSGSRDAAIITWSGDLANPSQLITVAAGKTVKAGIWNADANKRAFGVVYVCWEQ